MRAIVVPARGFGNWQFQIGFLGGYSCPVLEPVSASPSFPAQRRVVARYSVSEANFQVPLSTSKTTMLLLERMETRRPSITAVA